LNLALTVAFYPLPKRHAEFATWAAAGLWMAGTLLAYS
jgi:hypothetical protein